MKKDFLYSMMCALGGGLVGFSANRISEIYGSILFTLGIFLMTFSIIKLNK